MIGNTRSLFRHHCQLAMTTVLTPWKEWNHAAELDWGLLEHPDHAGVQRMFRARIGAQAFTVVAMVAGGAYYGADREKRKELIKLEAQQRAEERHNKWLRELEIRDEEEKALQDALQKRRDRKAAAAADKKDAPSAAAAAAAGGQDGSQKEGGSGGGVLGALSSAGGWFGTGKKEDKSSGEAAVEEKKPVEEKK